jgi:hypothetical protein
MRSTVFGISPETMVVTSTYVTRDRMPILYVTHESDEEGGSLWQFHCGNGDYDTAKMQLVRLDTILSIDPTIESVSDLPVGCSAQRPSRDDKWTLKREFRSEVL